MPPLTEPKCGALYPNAPYRCDEVVGHTTPHRAHSVKGEPIAEWWEFTRDMGSKPVGVERDA